MVVFVVTHLLNKSDEYGGMVKIIGVCSTRVKAEALMSHVSEKEHIPPFNLFITGCGVDEDLT